MSSKKSKNPLKALKKYFHPKTPTDTAVGPLGFQAEPPPPEGDQSGSSHQIQPDRPDSIARPDEDPKTLLVVQELHDKKSDDPGSLPQETPTPDVVVHRGADGANEPIDSHVRGIGGIEGDPAVASSGQGKFGRIRAILGAIYTVPGDPKESITVNNKVDNLLPRIIVLEEHFGARPHDDEEQKRRRELIDNFRGIEGRLRSLHESHGMEQQVDHFQCSEDVYGVLEDLQEAIYDYQVIHQMTIHEEECKLMNPAEVSVLNNFHCAQGAEFRHSDRKGCLRGTRRAILDEIELWTRDSYKPSLYWLNGLAGTGKSTIAQTIAERLSADGRLGASFFCSRDFEDRSNLHFIFPTLAVQLAQRHSNFRSIFVPLVKSDRGIVHESLYNQMNKLIVRPLVKSAISTVIVIDALDECKDEEPASAILSVLGRFLSQIPKVKFFLTGRPEPRILEGFRLPLLAQLTDVFILHEVESDQVNSDIRVLFRHEFSQLASRRRGLDDWPSEKELDLLCERAGGLFVYAIATIRVIGHRNSDPRKQLNRLLQSPKSSVLEGKTKFNADKTIDSLYLTILQEAFGDDDPEDDPRVRSIFGAVILAANPLSPSTIATILDFSTEDVFLPLLSAHSLLILHDDPSQPIRPFHKSFPDFIVDPGRCINQRFRVCPPDHHTELLVGCLKLLNQKLEPNMCKLPEWVTNSEVDDLKERTGQYVDQGLQYACRSWHKHLDETIPARKPDITSALHQFLEGNFLFWLEILSILSAAREAIEALEVAAKWLDASPTLNLVNDYFRFVIAYFEVIETSAPHIYHSALLLSPRSSTVWNLYEQYCRPLVRVVQGLPTSWDTTIATLRPPNSITAVGWSPCGRFIAFSRILSTAIEILDAITLRKIRTFTSPSSNAHWLCFSPDSRLLTGFSDELKLTSWDLQTGGLLDTISPKLNVWNVHFLSSTHSMDGKVVAVAYSDSLASPTFTAISTFDLTSRTYIYSHRASEGRIVASIWTHNERLQFATVKQEQIIIWGVGFTSTHTLAEVKTLPAPDEISDAEGLLFFHTLSRLAFTLPEEVLIWDAQDSKFLLNFEDSDWLENMDFSRDGRLFACGTWSGKIYTWKESPPGYTHHQELVFDISSAIKPLFSPDGESVIAYHRRTIQLCYTKEPTPSHSEVSSQPVCQSNFIVEISPDDAIAAVARLRETTITILDLECGEPRLIIDAGMEVLCLRVAGGTVVVVGEGKVVTWAVPADRHVLGARTNVDDSIQTTTFYHPEQSHRETVPCTAISPDLGRIAITERTTATSDILSVHDVSTGKPLADATPIEPQESLRMPWFTPDGRQVWCFGHCERGWTIVEGEEPDLVELSPMKQDELPSGASPRRSSLGYAITVGGWVVSPARKRLLWLPHSWRTNWMMDLTWGGRYLGLSQHALPEAVIMELYE